MSEKIKTMYSCEEHVGTITMNCPENLNAIDVTMAEELLQLLRQCDADPEVHTVVISGGETAFSAGGDIRFLYRRIQSGEPRTNELVERVGALTLAIKRMKKLVITSVRGSAAGAGANLAFSGDFCIAAENSKFIQAFVGIALVPDTGGAYLLSRIVGSTKALELCVTGRPVLAAEAKELGLIYEVCPPEELTERTQKLARRLARGPLLSYQKIKEQIFAASYLGYEQYLKQVEEGTMEICANSADYREGVCAFVEKRKPRFRGC